MVYGIDLGTTYSAITKLDDNGMPILIRNEDEGTELLASAVYFSEDGQIVVGKNAKEQAELEPERVIQFVKREIGKDNARTWEFNGTPYDAITISNLILKRMKEYAEKQGNIVKDVVITCPAYFGNEERAATKQAGQIAGLNVLNIVNEPTAAAINYCSREFAENRKILVYDLGGGTFDVTLLNFEVDENKKILIDIIASDGSDKLGGIDWDNRLFDFLCEKYGDATGIPRDEMEPELQQIIRTEVEQCKKDLTGLVKKTVNIRYAQKTPLIITREDFEEQTKDLVAQTVAFIHDLLNKTNLTTNDIDTVLLVGGSTRMPMIETAVNSLFSGKVRVEDPDMAVAKGAALTAGIEWLENFNQRKAAEENLNVTNIANEKNQVDNNDNDNFGISTFNQAPITAQEEEQAAAFMGMSNLGKISVVNDKLSRSFGPGVLADEQLTLYVIDNMLFLGDESPSELTNTYATVADNQPSLLIRVFENVSTDKINRQITPNLDADGNEQYSDPMLKVKFLGDIRLNLPPQTPKGTPVEVFFRCSAVGLEVRATNPATGESVDAVITSENTKTREQIEEEKARFEKITTSGQID
ncbi:MAG: Hsp70 family protein [Firmicutes bacterium]|nr:Hsp70 family protein [Bacillota bacterium]